MCFIAVLPAVLFTAPAIFFCAIITWQKNTTQLSVHKCTIIVWRKKFMFITKLKSPHQFWRDKHIINCRYLSSIYCCALRTQQYTPQCRIQISSDLPESVSTSPHSPDSSMNMGSLCTLAHKLLLTPQQAHCL